MGRRLKRIVATFTVASAVALSATAGWFKLSPAMTVEAMADAASRRDGDGVASRMDMQALRASTRLVAEDALRREIPSSDGVALNHRAITEILVGHVIDDIFSRKGTGRLVEGQSNPVAARGALRYRIVLVGPNRFVARLDGPQRVDLLFIRHGLGWLLSAIRMRAPEAPVNYV